MQFKTRLDWKAACAVISAFAMLMALGFWQLDRAAEKRRKQETIDARRAAQPRDFHEVQQNPTKSLAFQRVFLQGKYLPERTILLVNKFYRGFPGYEVLTAFRLQSGDRIVIVSRGWIASSGARNELPSIATPSGELVLAGEIDVPTGRSFFQNPPIREPAWPLSLSHLNPNEIAPLFSLPVFPYVVRLDETMPGVLNRYWPVPDMNPERSLSYAVQWFSMAFLLALVTILNCTNLADIIRSKTR